MEIRGVLQPRQRCITSLMASEQDFPFSPVKVTSPFFPPLQLGQEVCFLSSLVFCSTEVTEGVALPWILWVSIQGGDKQLMLALELWLLREKLQ